MIEVPLPRRLEAEILALGGDLKCRPALGQGDRVVVFDEVGDLAAPENQEALERLMDGRSPRVLVCDRHPGYFSTQLGHERARAAGIELRLVGHHRAHVAAVCLELGLLTETVVGLAFDGTGYGDDGLSWGGEIFVGSVTEGFTREAHFAPLPLPGGDEAVRAPWRIALALLLERGADDDLVRAWIERAGVPVRDLALFKKGLDRRIAVGRSTALGRWFDAVSALLGVAPVAGFEAEPAIKLQRLAESELDGQARMPVLPEQARMPVLPEQARMPVLPEQARAPVSPEDGTWPVELRSGAPMVIDFPGLVETAGKKLEAPGSLALGFHRAVARVVAEAASRLARAAGTDLVIASGGCFLNRLFDRLLEERLVALKLRYNKPRLLPPGDQALALGQIGLAAFGGEGAGRG